MNSCLLWLLAANLIHQNKCFYIPFQFSCHIKAFHYHVGSDFQKLCACGDIFICNFHIRHDIRVHLDNPLHQLDIVYVQPCTEFLIFVNQFLLEEFAQVWRITFCWFLQRTFLDQEVSWIDAQIVIEDDNWALFLQNPYLLIQLGVFISKQLSIKRIIDEQSHESTWSCLISWICKFLINLGYLVLDVL